VFIEATDVLMFRDSKPFTAGQNFTARSIFPPHPRIMQGVIRTHLMESQGVDFNEYAKGRIDPLIAQVVGTPTRFGSLSLMGPFIATQDEKANVIKPLYAPPLDLMKIKENRTDKQIRTVILKPARANESITNHPFDGWLPLLSKQPETMTELDVYLTESDFISYLRGEAPTLTELKLYDKELRTGLALDYSARRGQEHQFYQAEFIRPRRDQHFTTGLLVGIANDGGLYQDGAAYIGGEGRTAHFRTVSFAPQNVITAQTGNVKVVLLTPAWFSGGWHPTEGKWAKWLGSDAKLVAAAIGKHQLISGFNLATNGPRPMRQFVPAGSVFYFTDAQLNTDVAFTEDPADEGYAQMGFGAYATAAWNYLD
jgi:CRISPR-associated protein Cmr3